MLDDPDIQGLDAVATGVPGHALAAAPMTLAVGLVVPLALRRRRLGLSGRHPPGGL